MCVCSLVLCVFSHSLVTQPGILFQTFRMLSLFLSPRLSLSLQLTASGDTTVRLWDVVGGVSLASFRAHSGSIKSVDVKADEPSMCGS